jgi:hypothetical protein
VRGRQANILIIGAAALIVLGIVIWVHSLGGGISWQTNYDPKHDDPYDTYLLAELIASMHPEQEFIYGDSYLTKELIDSDRTEPVNYVFVGWSPSYLESEIDTLLQFAEMGNRVFIASNAPPYELVKYLAPGWQDNPEFRDSTVVASFKHPSLREQDQSFTFVRDHIPQTVEWNHFPEELLERREGRYDTLYRQEFLMEDEEYYEYDEYDSNLWVSVVDTVVFVPEVIQLGEVSGHLWPGKTKVNFIRMDYGKGAFYFHTNPIMFTNYFLLNEDHLAYTEHVISHLPPGDVYWDELSRHYKSSYTGDRGGGGINHSKGPLFFILDNPQLRWAFYIFLVLVVFYVLFRAKRRQRAIPVLEPNTNTSMEFIDTIGRLFFKAQDHRGLALSKMDLFLAFVRERYRIKTKRLDTEFTKLLAAKSQVTTADIDMIVNQYEVVRNAEDISEISLVYFHNRIEEFFKKCK